MKSKEVFTYKNKKYKLHIPGTPLGENEYLLKIYEGTGFMTKLTQKGEYPLQFKSWGNYHHSQYYNSKKGESLPEDLPIYVIEETFKNGWSIINWRFGKSQNWAVLQHPDGFLIEIYLKDLLSIIKNNTILNGKIIGEFKWEHYKLIKKS